MDKIDRELCKVFTEEISDGNEKFETFKECMRIGDYERYLFLLPNNIYLIVAGLLNYCEEEIEFHTLETFKKFKWDINKPCYLYACEEDYSHNVLTYACEKHNISLMRNAIAAGAKVNIKIKGITPLYSLFDADVYGEKLQSFKESLEILLNNDVRRILPDSLLDYTLITDKYCVDFLDSCTVIDDNDWEDYEL